ncbi:MAG: 50S ribosomal protein L10 [Candidatus Micrarchaeia archaeon]
MLTKDQKIRFVEDAKKMIQSYSTIGVVELNSIPDRLLQSVRNSMSNEAKLIIGRKSLLGRILDANDSTKMLAQHLSGTSAIILSNDDPFELYQKFKAKSIKLEAKPGQVANSDIEIKSGETTLQPGQAVTDLKSAGIDVQIQKGKVVISKDKILVKKGETVELSVAKALHLLGVMPFTAVMAPKVLLSNGVIFSSEVLGRTKEQTILEIGDAFSKALALSLELGIVNSYTIERLIGKAYRIALGLGIAANIYAPGIIERILEKAYAQASALNALKQNA